MIASLRVGTKLAVAAVPILIVELWPFLLVATSGNIIRTLVGERLLRRIPEFIYRRLVACLVQVLGIYMLLQISR